MTERSGGSEARRESNPRATVSLVLGILGIVLALLSDRVGAVTGSVAIVLAVVARRQDERRGTALAGMITGAVAVVLGVVLIVLNSVLAPPA